jgi:hypothetical protein
VSRALTSLDSRRPVKLRSSTSTPRGRVEHETLLCHELETLGVVDVVGLFAAHLAQDLCGGPVPLDGRQLLPLGPPLGDLPRVGPVADPLLLRDRRPARWAWRVSSRPRVSVEPARSACSSRSSQSGQVSSGDKPVGDDFVEGLVEVSPGFGQW